MNYDFCTDLTLEPNKMAGCSKEKKTGAAAKHLLKQTADCTVLQSQIDWTIEPLNEKSQIAQEYGLLPADAWQQQHSGHAQQRSFLIHAKLARCHSVTVHFQNSFTKPLKSGTQLNPI